MKAEFANVTSPGMTRGRRVSLAFPVAHSVLSAHAVLTEADGTFAIAPPSTCQLLRRGFNDTYLLQSRDERCIARVYRAQWRTPSDIAYELELLLHLAAKGVSVSTPIATRDGNLLRRLSMPEGTRFLALFTYAKGTPLRWTEEHSFLAGRLLAAIHAASDGFVSRHERFRLDLEYLMDRPLAAIRPFLRHRPEDWSFLESLAGKLRIRAEEAVRAGLDCGVCHGDFGGNVNINVAGELRLTAFDFDFCGPGWRAYDFVPAKRIATGRNNSRIWESFLAGYAERRSLAAADQEAVALFDGINRLWSFGLRVNSVGLRGIETVEHGALDRRLSVLREWRGEHL